MKGLYISLAQKGYWRIPIRQTYSLSQRPELAGPESGDSSLLYIYLAQKGYWRIPIRQIIFDKRTTGASLTGIRR